MKGEQGYKVRTITCVNCGKSVTGHLRPDQRYCSLECYRMGKRPMRKTGETHTCAVCGVEVYISRYRLGQPLYFCGIEHANEWQGRNKTNHICKICSKAFRWSPSRHKANNITYCSLACRNADPARREMLIAMNAVQQRLHTNNVERAGYALLDALGVAYEPQCVIGGKFCVDAFVPSHGLVIQWDGDYWHGNPTHFPEPDARQRHRMRLDRSQDAYMAACGYRVVRVWASDLERASGQVAERLRAALALPTRTSAAQE
jgi:very-short-patch-repair endonuclease